MNYADKFIEVWRRSSSAIEVAEELGIKPASASGRASKYRSRGIEMKDMSREKGRGIYVSKLFLAKKEIKRLTAQVDRWARWSTLDRDKVSFAPFDFEAIKIRHDIADFEKTCDFQTLHHDRKDLIEHAEKLTTVNARLLKDLQIIHAMADSDNPEPDIVEFVKNQSYMAIHESTASGRRKKTARETCGRNDCPVEDFYVNCSKCNLMIQPNFPPSDEIAND